jgi:hypothetical protein
MHKQIKFTDFDQIDLVEPPENLYRTVVLKIEKARRKDVLKILAGLITSAFVCLGFCGYAVILLYYSFYKTGTIVLVESVLQNLNLLRSAWVDVTLAIIESLPVVEIIFFLLSTVLLLSMVRLALKKGILIRKFHAV